jgi:hypothetical protein|tara:strand:+ start:267 stop:386 length:120 start_codon:yes stop_codon:yes gene_type:complete
MIFWLFSIFDYYYNFEENEIKKMRKQLRHEAENKYGLNI